MEKIQILVGDVHCLLDKGAYIAAKEKIISAVKKVDASSENYNYLLATIAGLFIDLGTESYDKESIDAGIKILRENEKVVKACMSDQSFNYNMGNGINALYKIQMRNVGLPTLEMIKPNLTEAKN